MSNNPALKLFRRKPLDEITSVPNDIISVYVVEQHIWSNPGWKMAGGWRASCGSPNSERSKNS